MHWRKGDQRKTDFAIVGGMLLLTLMIVVIALVQTAPLGQATQTGAVQATPTVDATAVVQDQLKQQDEKLQRDNLFPWTILNAVGGSIGTMLAAVAALIAAWLGWRQWLTNRKDEQRKRDEEHFQKVVEGLGSEREEAKVGAAIVLRTFLQPGYEQFYSQAFALAVAHLRLRKTSSSTPASRDLYIEAFLRAKASQPLSSLNQALITVFEQSFPRARGEIKESNLFDPKSLDATGIQLDSAYLASADLRKARMQRVSLREANLTGARLEEVDLTEADLTGADLTGAHLTGATLIGVTLTRAILRGATLAGANLTEATLEGAVLTQHTKTGQETNLTGAILTKATLKRADFTGAILTKAILTEVKNASGTLFLGANLEGASFTGAILTEVNFTGAILTDTRFAEADLTRANFLQAQLKGARPGDGSTLQDAEMFDVKDLDPDQNTKCKNKGARFEKVT